MNRPYFLALAAGAALTLLPVTAHADRAKPSGHSEQRAPWAGQTGQASYYGKAHHGKRTASGARFDQNQMTAAHPYLPFGARVRVTDLATGNSVVVVITDRLPSKRRIVDLSHGAAKQLGIIRRGIAQVEIVLA